MAEQPVKTLPAYPFPTPLDVPKLRKHLNEDDEMLLVIRAHLYIDVLMNAIIEHYLTRPALVEIDRIPFPQRVQLVSGFGVIDEALMRSCLYVNRLRNLMAHDVNFAITDKHRRELWASLPAHSRKHLNKKRRPIISIKLSEIMKDIVVHIDMARHGYKTWKQERDDTLVYTRKLIESLDTGSAMPEKPAHMMRKEQRDGVKPGAPDQTSHAGVKERRTAAFTSVPMLISRCATCASNWSSVSVPSIFARIVST